MFVALINLCMCFLWSDFYILDSEGNVLAFAPEFLDDCKDFYLLAL